MGTNFHTAWTTVKKFLTTDMNPVPASLDQAITYLKNVMVSCAGAVTFTTGTGTLTWGGAIEIIFTDSAGLAKKNTVTASNIVVGDNQFAYVDLSETNNAVLTLAVATVTTGSASNFKAYNRLVLGYRNSTTDEFYSPYFVIIPEP